MGIRSAAIVLMHAYRYPGHELKLGELAREIGFTQVTLSQQASPLMKIVSRGETAVVGCISFSSASQVCRYGPEKSGRKWGK